MPLLLLLALFVTVDDLPTCYSDLVDKSAEHRVKLLLHFFEGLLSFISV